MNHKQQHTLAAIFHDPVSANIHWREIESLLKAAGAELEESHGARLRVLLNGLEETLHRPPPQRRPDQGECAQPAQVPQRGRCHTPHPLSPQIWRPRDAL